MNNVIVTGFVSVIVSLTNKRSWIHRARRSDNYKGDEDEKQFLINLLKEEFGISSIRPEPILTHSGRPRYADVVSTNTNPPFYFELDGEYHGSGDEISTTEDTWRRNQDYEDLGFKLLIINKEDTDGYDRKKVIERLNALFKLFDFEPPKN